MEPVRYDILRTENKSAIWLEASVDLIAAKARIKAIASFWPGKYEVVDHQSQRIVASIASPILLRFPLRHVRESLRKSLWASYKWLLGPAPRLADLPAYKSMRRYTQERYWMSRQWLCSSAARVQAYRSR